MARCGKTELNRTSNPTEKEFSGAAQANGWNIAKRGWPDYLCWKDGELIFVEVKPEGKRLKRHQLLVMNKLADLGLKCYRWSPEQGFTRIWPGKNALPKSIGKGSGLTLKGDMPPAVQHRSPRVPVPSDNKQPGLAC